METAIISLMCIALIVFGGMTMSQGFLSSVDTAGSGVGEISMRDGEIMRTELAAVNGNNVSWANILRVRLENSGQIKLASFSKWDFIVEYYDGSGTYYTKWLPYTSEEPGNDEWQKIGIYVNGNAEAFEPAIFNPGEEMVFGTRLSPSPGADTTAGIIISTPNGVRESISFPVGPGYPLFTPHSENRTIASTEYYWLKEGIRSDGTEIIETTDSIARRETGRWILHNESDDSRLGKHIYSLAGIDTIPASTWTVYYRAQATRDWRGYPSLSIDIIIRKADGTVRETIATDVADAVIANPYDWQTISATYDFPGHTVVDDTDYLEIDYYGKSSDGGPAEDDTYIQLSVDDSGLTEAEQTRIEA